MGTVDNINLADFSADYTRRLNRIADEIKVKYTRFVDDCCRSYGESIYMWATPFVSRNVFNDATYLHICRILLVKELINEEAADYAGVITDNIYEAEVLKKLVPDNMYVRCTVKRVLIDSISGFKQQIETLGSYIRKQLDYIRYSPEDYKYPDRFSIVIGPAISKDFDGYVYNDRYTTNIEEYAKVLFLPYTINNSDQSYRCLLDRIKNCTNKEFIYDRSLVRVSDVWEILRYWRYADRLKHCIFMYDGIDVSPIVYESLKKGKLNSTSIGGLLTRRMLKRLSDKNLAIDSFILWYEGRPYDILNASSIREFFPNALCIGYQGYPLPEVVLSEYISDFQYLSERSPHKMAIPSRLYETESHQFCNSIPLVVIPILRNEYNMRVSNRKTTDGYRILVLLSYFENATRELIEYVLEYVRDAEMPCSVVFKNHPVNRGKTINDYGYSELSFSPDYVEGKLTDCLEGVDVVVTSLTSSTLEVAFAGIPLVILCPKGELGYTALPQSLRAKFCRVVYDLKQMTEALNRYYEDETLDLEALDGVLVSKTTENVACMFA